MKNHTSLIISRYTQNTGKLLDQVIVIRKTPDPLRKTPDPLWKTPDPLRKTPDLTSVSLPGGFRLCFFLQQ